MTNIFRVSHIFVNLLTEKYNNQEMKQNPIVRDKRAITGLSLTQKVSTI